VGDTEDKYILLLFTNILPLAVLELFWILVAKFTVCDRLCVANNEASFFFGCFQSGNLCLCLQKLKVPLQVYIDISEHHVDFLYIV